MVIITVVGTKALVVHEGNKREVLPLVLNDWLLLVLILLPVVHEAIHELSIVVDVPLEIEVLLRITRSIEQVYEGSLEMVKEHVTIAYALYPIEL